MTPFIAEEMIKNIFSYLVRSSNLALANELMLIVEKIRTNAKSDWHNRNQENIANMPIWGSW